MKLDQITPDRLKTVPEQELLSLHLRTHQLWAAHFKGNQAPAAGDLTREGLAQLHAKIAAEMDRRGLSHAKHLMKSARSRKPQGLACEPARARSLLNGSLRVLLADSDKRFPVQSRVIVVAGTPAKGKPAQALGEIRLDPPFEVSKADLNHLKGVTGIPLEKGNVLFPKAARLWGYPVQILRRYDKPRVVQEARKVPLKDPVAAGAAPAPAKPGHPEKLSGKPEQIEKADPLAAARPAPRQTQVALAFIFDAAARTFLVTHTRGKIWTPPSGYLHGRQPGLAAYQEARQESGLTIEPQGTLPPLRAQDVEIFPFVFVAWGDPNVRVPPGLEGRWFAPEEVAKLPIVPSYNLYRRAIQVLTKPTIDIVRAHDRPETLSPQELAETDAWLHIMGRIDTDTHEILRAEMERRHITHPGGDLHPETDPAGAHYETLAQSDGAPLDGLDAARAAEVRSLYDGAPEEFVVVPEWASVSGSTLYAQSREPNDTDWIFREPYPSQGALLKVGRISKELTRRPTHFSFESSGPNWPYLPVYDLVARKRASAEIRAMEEPAFNRFEKAGDLPTDGRDFHLDRPFAHYKAEGEYDPREIKDLWTKWVEPSLRAGHAIVIQEKFDGMRLHLHWDGTTVHLFSESGAERAAVFPDLKELARSLDAKDFALDCEFVQWTDDNKKPAPRWVMTWMIVGKEPRPVPVHIDVHDLMWLNGRSLVDQPYHARRDRLAKLLPQPVTRGALTLQAAETRTVTDQASLDAGLDWARGIVGSEGAMLKWDDFRYHAGVVPGIVKAKSVTEIDVAILGWKKNPAPKPAGAHWTAAEAASHYAQALTDSRTYIFRVAVAHDGKLVPLESAKSLTAKDLKLSWNERLQKWEGTEDPTLWHMCPGFENRGAGEFAYANTYSLAMDQPPFCHEVLTVAPMQFRPFRKEDGTYGYAWMFPKVKNTKLKGSVPGELADILAKFGLEPVERYLKPTTLKTELRQSATADARQGIMVALPVPTAVGERLIAEAKKVLPADADLLEPDELHITLAYLGNVDESTAHQKDAQAALDEFAGSWAPLEGEISGVGRFNGDGTESAFYASFDSPQLPQFQQALAKTLEAHGVRISQDHGFTPHITLAYVHGASEKLPALPTTPLRFDRLALAWGLDWTDYPLRASSLVKAGLSDFPPLDPEQLKVDAVTCPTCGAKLKAPAAGWARCGWCKAAFNLAPDGQVRTAEQAGGTVPFCPFVKVLAPGKSELKKAEVEKKTDPYVNPPLPEGKSRRFVVQHHYRGRSVHLDLRIEHDGFLVGWTVMEEVPGQIRQPVESLAQARAVDRDAAAWKIDWKTGNIRDRQIRNGIIRRASLRAAEKAEEIPEQWLTIEGVTTKTEPGQPPPTGATRNFPGVFSIVDQGTVEYGAQKPWLHEYFFHGGHLKGRWLLRLLSGPDLQRVKKAEGPLPAGQPDASSTEPYLWLVIQPLDQTPYVLTKEAVEKGWLPPPGVSALPKELRDQIPTDRRYWTLTGEAALAARKDLAENWEELSGPGLAKSEHLTPDLAAAFDLPLGSPAGPVFPPFPVPPPAGDAVVPPAPDAAPAPGAPAGFNVPEGIP